MDLLKAFFLTIIGVSMICIVVIFFGIRTEITEIKTISLERQRIEQFQMKKQMEHYKNFDERKQNIGENWGEWKATKEKCVEKLNKIEYMLKNGKFVSKEDEKSVIDKFNRLKAAVEKEDADYTELFKEIKLLIEDLK